MTSGMPESTVATAELVVPKSMPTILLIINFAGDELTNLKIFGKSETPHVVTYTERKCGQRREKAKGKLQLVNCYD